MKQYYLHVNNKQEGPFSFDELKQLSLHSEVLIWYDGIENWKEAGQIEVLKDFFTTKHSVEFSTGLLRLHHGTKPIANNTEKDKNWPILLVYIVLFLALVYGVFTYLNII